MNLDIFPRAADPGSMEDRRAVLVRALKVAGLALTSPLIPPAIPYVRLPVEQGTITDERRRFAYEITGVNAQLLRQPARQNQPALLALWANLHQFQRTAHVHVFDLRAWCAILGSVNAVTLQDQASAAAWLQQAHSNARLAGDPDLISLAHSKAANAGMYFNVAPRYLIADAALAIKYGTTPERQGMGHAMMARAAAIAGKPSVAIRAGEHALALADGTDPAPSPRTDGWVTGQAHMTISRSLSGFPQLLPAVEEHVREALRANPESGTLWRAQPLLNVADVRVRAGAPDGGAEVIMSVLDELSPAQLQPSLLRRMGDVSQLAELRFPNTAAFRPVRERLTSLRAT